MNELEEILEEAGYDGWEAPDNDTLVCPHGTAIELDGRCPDGCESPLLTLGLI